MATTIRVQVTLPNVNGLPGDAFVNTWHFNAGVIAPVTWAQEAIDNLKTFYSAVDVFLSNTVNPAITYKAYNLIDSEPRSPIVEDSQTLTLGANAPLPHEVAMVLSFAGASGSGVNIARRRGRIFLGPLDSAVMDDSLGQSIIQTSTITAVAAAAEALNEDFGDLLHGWAVFSPTTAGPSPWTEGELIASTNRVRTGFVDNSFDTLRSRGIAATARQSWIASL